MTRVTGENPRRHSRNASARIAALRGPAPPARVPLRTRRRKRPASVASRAHVTRVTGEIPRRHSRNASARIAALRGPAPPAGAPVASDATTGSVIQVTEVSRPSRCCSGDEGESRDRTGMSCPITAQQPPVGRERSRLATASPRHAAGWSDRDGDAHPGSTGPMGANGSSTARPPRHRECPGHSGAGPFRAAAGTHS